MISRSDYSHSRVASSLLTICISLFSVQAAFGFTATLTPSFNSPGMVGQVVTWNAGTGSDNPNPNMRYRFRVRAEGSNGAYDVIRDYSPDLSMDWTAADREGFYLVELTAVDISKGEISTTTERFQMLPRIQGNQPLLSPTNNPLVFLFSAPPCEAGSRMRVRFNAPTAEATPMFTSYKECNGATTMNFYLAGLLPNTSYRARAFVESASSTVTSGPAAVFESGDTPQLTETLAVETPAAAGAAQKVLLTSNGFATDLAGIPIWGGTSPVTILTRPDAGGYFWGLVEDSALDIAHQAIRKFDLTGRVVMETNAERVNQQLGVLGKRKISSFHHEARPLPDGRMVALATVEEIVTNVQGPGAVNVLGDMIIVFDRDLNVIWTWDTFDWLDVSRPAILGETCSNGIGGCPPFYLTEHANDWTHGNAIQLTPDGAFLYSTRHLDWLIKIDYANGAGDGHVIWRLGRGGDFTWISSDSWPWFSHQHDGNIDFQDPTKLIVFDNGNTRWSETGEAYSRGQVIQLDESTMTATPVLNANLGVFAAAVGSAQKLTNGNYHFDAGYVIQPNNSLAAFAIEMDPAGQITYQLRTEGFVYRSFRLKDLYTPD